MPPNSAKANPRHKFLGYTQVEFQHSGQRFGLDDHARKAFQRVNSSGNSYTPFGFPHHVSANWPCFSSEDLVVHRVPDIPECVREPAKNGRYLGIEMFSTFPKNDCAGLVMRNGRFIAAFGSYSVVKVGDRHNTG